MTDAREAVYEHQPVSRVERLSASEIYLDRLDSNTPPDAIQALMERDRNPYAMPLSNGERHQLQAWRSFPNPVDDQARSLYERQLNGEQLNDRERAQLQSAHAFPPHLARYRELYVRQILSANDQTQRLTASEESTLREGFLAAMAYRERRN